MANKYKWTRTENNRRWRAVYNPPFYDTARNDTGNYNSLGVMVGSMRGISAPKWESIIGHPPTAAEMQAITAEQAENIYFTDYWDEVKGDQINSQKIAELIADVKSSTGNVKTLQKTLGQTQTGQMNNSNLEALNAELATNAQGFYDRYRANLVSYYSGISGAASHLRRLDRDYPQDLKIDTISPTLVQKYIHIGFFLLLGLAAVYVGYLMYSYFFVAKGMSAKSSLYL